MYFIKTIAILCLIFGFSNCHLFADNSSCEIDCPLFVRCKSSAAVKSLIDKGFNLVYVGVASKKSLNELNKFYKIDYEEKCSNLVVKFSRGDEIRVLLLQSESFLSSFIYPSYKISFADKVFKSVKNPIIPNYLHKEIPFENFENALRTANAELKKIISDFDLDKYIENDKKELENKIEKIKVELSTLKNQREIEANKNLTAILEKQLRYLSQNSDEIKNEIRTFYSTKFVTLIYVNTRGQIEIENNAIFSQNQIGDVEDTLDGKKISLTYNPESDEVKFKK